MNPLWEWVSAHPFWIILIFFLVGVITCGIRLPFKKPAQDGAAPKIKLPFVLFTVWMILEALALHENHEEGLGFWRGLMTFDSSLFAWTARLWAAGLALCLLTGWWDDRRGIRGAIKLPILLLATAVPIFMEMRLLNSSPWWSISNIEMGFVYLFALIALVALPLIDGINGLYPGMVTLTCGWLLFLNGTNVNDNGPFNFYIPLAGLLLAALVWNFPRAKLRLGEAAVLPVSYLVSHYTAFVMLQGVGVHSGGSPWLPDIIWVTLPWLYPVADFVLVVTGRMRHGRSPFKGGRDHLHHRLIISGFSQNQTAVFLWCAQGVVLGTAAGAYLLQRGPTINHSSLVFTQSALLITGLFPMLYLFWRGYTKVNPYNSGAVDERGRP